MTWTSLLIESWESLAVNRNTYVPAPLNETFVTAAVGLVNAAVPGPLAWLQITDRLLPAGRPSSLTLPFSVALEGMVIVRSGPAFTVGGKFCGMTVIVTSLLLVRSESKAVNRKTYVPDWLNVAVVTALVALAKVTLPAPLTLVQLEVGELPWGSPSSVTEPFKAAPPGSVIVWLAPALTTAGWLTGGKALSLRRNSPPPFTIRRSQATVPTNCAFALMITVPAGDLTFA